jgi:hypothetical protein
VQANAGVHAAARRQLDWDCPKLGDQINVKAEKRLQRFLSVPADFTWDELVGLLADVGFREISAKGGSYRTFLAASGKKIFIHRPHPNTIIKRYAIREAIATLKDFGIFLGK